MADMKEGSLRNSAHPSEDGKGTNGFHSAHVESSGMGAQKRGFGGKVRHSCRRYWWLYLLIAAGILLIILLPLFYVGYPNIVQKDVNESKLNVTSMTVLNTDPNGFDLNLTSLLTTHSAFHPRFYPFYADLHLGDAQDPFLSIPIPTFVSKNNRVIPSVSHQLVNNSQAFTDFAIALLANESLRIHVTGKPNLRQGKLFKTKATYTKDVYQTAFNALQGVVITNLTVVNPPAADGANLVGQMHIPNPTVLTLDMGDVALNLTVPGNLTNTTSDFPIGVAQLRNVIVKPGNDNVFEARAISDQIALITIVQKFPEVAGPAGLPLYGRGINATRNGQNMEYLSKALAANKLSTNLYIRDALIQAGLGGLIPNSSSTSTSSTSSSTSAAFGGFPTQSSSSSGGLFGFPQPSSSSSGGFFGFPTTTSSAAGFGFGFPTSTSQTLFGFPAATTTNQGFGFGQQTSTISEGTFPTQA